MCENIFKNQEEKKRKEDFTRLFVALASNVGVVKMQPAKKTEKTI